MANMSSRASGMNVRAPTAPAAQLVYSHQAPPRNATRKRYSRATHRALTQLLPFISTTTAACTSAQVRSVEAPDRAALMTLRPPPRTSPFVLEAAKMVEMLARAALPQSGGPFFLRARPKNAAPPVVFWGF